MLQPILLPFRLKFAYGLKVPSYGTNLNIYRRICKKYPTIDKRKVLLGLIEKSGIKGKWFADAKTAGQNCRKEC